MNVLIVGASSYLAEVFIKQYKDVYDIKAISRNDGLISYFDLQLGDFANIDIVVNFAAIVHKKNPDPKLSHDVNSKLPAYLANLAKEVGVQQFIHISSIAVYSSGLSFINDKTHPEPDTVYGRTKLEGEHRLRSLESNAFKVSILRPPMIYGKRAPGNMQKLICLLEASPLLPFAYKNNHRSMLYIDNFISALHGIISQNLGGTYLICDEFAPSLYTLSTTINKYIKKETILFPLPYFFVKLLISIRFLPFDKLYGDLVIDDTKTRNELGRYALTGLSEAIGRTVKGIEC